MEQQAVVIMLSGKLHKIIPVLRGLRIELQRNGPQTGFHIQDRLLRQVLPGICVQSVSDRQTVPSRHFDLRFAVGGLLPATIVSACGKRHRRNDHQDCLFHIATVYISIVYSLILNISQTKQESPYMGLLLSTFCDDYRIFELKKRMPNLPNTFGML